MGNASLVVGVLVSFKAFRNSPLVDYVTIFIFTTFVIS